MSKSNAENARIKYRYRQHLKEAEGMSEASLDVVDKAIARFESYTGLKDFRTFHFEQAIAFKKHLSRQNAEATGKPLSVSTQHATLRALQKFIRWLAQEPGYRSRIQYCHADYFNLPLKACAIAGTRRNRPCPTLDQISHVLRELPAETHIQKRDRALIAFTTLTGARDHAIITLKLKHVDIVTGHVYQDARDVSTKRSKSIDTYFFPVGDTIRQIVVDWVLLLRKELLWGEDDPLFPTTDVGLVEHGQFGPKGLKREHWATTNPVRRIFQDSFKHASLPYYNPHSFRNTLVRLGERVCKTPEEFKAWSQNFGHSEVLTTFMSYGEVPVSRQAEIFEGMASRQAQL